MSKVSNHQELAEALCAALQADADEAAVAAFVDGLYESDEALHTRDTISINLVKPIAG